MQLTDNNPVTHSPILLDVSGITLRLTHAEFERLCQDNPERVFELTKDGELEIMSPVGGDSGSYESELTIDLGNWNRQTRLGRTFSSSTAFILPNGAERSPDAAWVELSRWEALTPEQRKKFPPLAPDFAIELRSETDSLKKLQQRRNSLREGFANDWEVSSQLCATRQKMVEYRDNGVRLGWLINPQQQQVEIYRQERDVEVLEHPISLDGEDVLPGFVLDLRAIF